MTAVAAAPRSGKVASRKLLWAGPLAGVAAAASNLLIFGLASAVLNLPLQMPPMGPNPAAPLNAAQVIISSFLPALVAAGLLALLGRFTARPVRVFQIIAGVVLVLSLGAPFSIPADTATRLVLLSMHLVAGLVITGVLSKFGADGKR